MFTNIPAPVIVPYTPSQSDNLHTLSVGGGKRSLRVDKEGLALGGENWKNAPFRVDMDGNTRMNNADIRGTISGRSTDTIARVISQTGEIVTEKINTDTGQILKNFTFAGYEGAFKAGNIEWNRDGQITRGTGVVMNNNGLVGAKNGEAKFVLNANGDATFGGHLTAPSGTLGRITAGDIYGANIFSPNIKTAETGKRVEINTANKVQIFDDRGNEVANYGYNSGQQNDNILWAKVDNDGKNAPIIYAESGRLSNTGRFVGKANIQHPVVSIEAKDKREQGLAVTGITNLNGDVIINGANNAKIYLGYNNSYLRNDGGTLIFNTGNGEREVYHSGNLPTSSLPSSGYMNSLGLGSLILNGHRIIPRAVNIGGEIHYLLTY